MLTLRRPLASLAALAVAVTFVLIGALVPASCMTFSGLTVPEKKTMSVDATPEGGPPPVVGFLSLSDAAKVCSQIFKCPQLAQSVLRAIAVPLDRLNFSLCMDWVAGPVPQTRVGRTSQAETLACVAAAPTCGEAAKCLSQEIMAADDPRCVGQPVDAGDRCSPDGLAVIRCQYLDVLNCQTARYGPGSKCLKGTDGRYWCGVDRNCPPLDTCQGSLLDYCGTSGVHASINCASAGYTCGMDPDSGYNDCLTGDRLRACTAEGATCNGDVVAVCDAFNISEFDCASMGAKCAKNGSSARCARDTDQCSPLDGNLNTCTDSTLSLCVGGKPVAFDCASIGKNCVPGKGSQSGRCD